MPVEDFKVHYINKTITAASSKKLHLPYCAHAHCTLPIPLISTHNAHIYITGSA